jgi:16S rRNA (guanine966-N2)-methyltransferase
VTFFETAPAAQAVIAANVKKLGCEKEATLLRQDATHPPKAAEPCRFLLLDPPYKSGLASPALTALAAQGWIAPDARIIVEVAAAEMFASPLPDFQIADERRYGAARLIFLTSVSRGR